jgi:hypothetical protein
MPFRKVGRFLSLFPVLCAVVPVALTAQQNREPMAATYSATGDALDGRSNRVASRMLTSDEGLAVIGAALESRANPDLESDCSHLVHAIYERAGFPYAYASSSTLYGGSGEFRRVTRPQPGDLVVWAGHVGIMVNPAQRSFFSALRSGLGVDSYDSAYWRERGHPRFLRYITAVPVTIRADASSREDNAEARASSEAHPLAARNMGFTASEEPQTQPHAATNAIRSSQIVKSQHPKAKEVTDALEQAFAENAEALRGQDVLEPSCPLMAFDEVSVERVSLQGNRGWAEVRMNGVLKLPGDGKNSARRTERQRWLLVRRGHDTWELALPTEAIYVPSDVAVRMLVRQLEGLTEETVEQPIRAEKKVQLSRLLNMLLEKQIAPGA